MCFAGPVPQAWEAGQMMSRITNTIRVAMKSRLSVLLEGPHGVGKTQMVREEANRQDLRLKYYSSATLDPWADLVGIPVPAADTGDGSAGESLRFVRPRDVDSAELIFFDELNRSHPRVQNAVLELVQFGTLNGERLASLQSVWAAINPPGGSYEVTELDPALVDRFAVHLTVPASPSVDYYCRVGVPRKIAGALVAWWNRDLDEDLQRFVSPRRLEHIARNIEAGVDLRFSIPQGRKVPLASLAHRLGGESLLPFELTRVNLVARQEELLVEMEQGNPEVMLAVCERLAEWPDLVANCLGLFMGLSSELQARLVANSRIALSLRNLARNGGRDRAMRPLADRLGAMGIM